MRFHALAHARIAYQTIPGIRGRIRSTNINPARTKALTATCSRPLAAGHAVTAFEHYKREKDSRISFRVIRNKVFSSNWNLPVHGCLSDGNIVAAAGGLGFEGAGLWGLIEHAL